MKEADCWSAVLSRERTDSFVYAVKTTHVYCRPSCPSRRPKKENVEFFESAGRAENAGYRACRRCDPQRPEPRTALVSDLCRFMEANADRRITLAELSRFASMSLFHLQRTFRAELGVTPREYMATLRTRDSAPGEIVIWTITDSPLGRMLVAESRRGLCAVSFGSSDSELTDWLRRQMPWADLREGTLNESATAVLKAVGTGRCDVPLDIRGTVFQQKVWQALRSIGSGETRTYEELAALAGAPHAVRAAASACAKNRLAVVIPCHRIIRKDGSPGGYRWGLERKQELLAREQAR